MIHRNREQRRALLDRLEGRALFAFVPVGGEPWVAWSNRGPAEDRQLADRRESLNNVVRAPDGKRVATLRFDDTFGYSSTVRRYLPNGTPDASFSPDPEQDPGVVRVDDGGFFGSSGPLIKGVTSSRSGAVFIELSKQQFYPGFVIDLPFSSSSINIPNPTDASVVDQDLYNARPLANGNWSFTLVQTLVDLRPDATTPAYERSVQLIEYSVDLGIVKSTKLPILNTVLSRAAANWLFNSPNSPQNYYAELPDNYFDFLVNDVDTQADGKLLVSGARRTTGNRWVGYVGRFNGNGTLDTSFGARGFATFNVQGTPTRTLQVIPLPDGGAEVLNLWADKHQLTQLDSRGRARPGMSHVVDLGTGPNAGQWFSRVDSKNFVVSTGDGVLQYNVNGKTQSLRITQGLYTMTGMWMDGSTLQVARFYSNYVNSNAWEATGQFEHRAEALSFSVTPIV